ncbi:YidC/Oxa1 family membrane protein insertase [Mollicutes bacterium LVI A0078]|nr:YidC/Oxa1 family membrane protein insertase [Mollicutes bacterium LVI A0075]WOO91081.1 YidC/Oxa1 family membrane protein insertase [Mollicutes bacterium LVI A0078]
MKKQHRFLLLMLPLVVVLTGCGTPTPIDVDPSGIWNTVVYWLAQMIVQLGHIFGENIGWGLVFATLIVRVAMIPLYRKQIRSTEAMNKVQPEMKKIQDKYKNVAKDDKEAQMRQQQEMSALYQRHGVNPLAGCLPLLIQMPILFAFYDAIQGLLINGTYMDPVQAANQGLINLGGGEMSSTLLGFDLGSRVILFAILAGATTWLSTKLSMAGTETPEGAAGDISKSMLTVMPIMIFVMGLTLPGALSVYWLVGNLVTIAQTAYFKRDKIFNSRRAELTQK